MRQIEPEKSWKQPTFTVMLDSSMKEVKIVNERSTDVLKPLTECESVGFEDGLAEEENWMSFLIMMVFCS